MRTEDPGLGWSLAGRGKTLAGPPSVLGQAGIGDVSRAASWGLERQENMEELAPALHLVPTDHLPPSLGAPQHPRLGRPRSHCLGPGMRRPRQAGIFKSSQDQTRRWEFLTAAPSALWTSGNGHLGNLVSTCDG